MTNKRHQRSNGLEGGDRVRRKPIIGQKPDEFKGREEHELCIDDFIERTEERRERRGVAVCVLEKRMEVRWNGGGGYKQRSKIVYLVGVQTGKWYIGKGKGKEGTWGKGWEKASG